MKIAVYGNVMQYQADLSNMIMDAENMLNSFKIVKQSTVSLNGGAGTLASAVDDIDKRIQKEEVKRNSAIEVKKKSNDFLQLAQRVDNNVASLVDKYKEELYYVNPWLRPVSAIKKEKPWYEKTWEWLCGKGEAIVEEAKKVRNWIGDTANKIWVGLVAFYEESKNLCKILIGTGAIAVAVVVTIATGGVAVPVLLAMVKTALISGLISAAIGGSISAVVSLAQGDSLDTIISNSFNASLDGFCSGFMWGGIFAAGSQIITTTLLPKTPDNISLARENGVREAKKIELNAIKNNSSKYDWSPAQKAEFLRTGKFNGIDGCHILDASRYPQFANDPRNIILLPRWTHHFSIVHGCSWTNPSDWIRIIEIMPQFSRQVSHMKHLAVVSKLLSLQIVPIIIGSGIGVVTSQ